MSFRVWTRTLPAVAAALALSVSAAAAQSGRITGSVTDATTGEPVVGAQMVIPGTNLDALTNQAGRYLVLGVPVGEVQIRVMIIGYSQQTETVTVSDGGTATVDFQLSVSAIQLEGVIVNAVTGQAQRARELGTNTTTIEVEQIASASITSMSDLLSARSEGVILQDVNGTTGSAQRIRIRGANSLSLSNEPLIYVDGIQFNNDNTLSQGVGGQEAGRLNDINPNDIDRIEVVKGPAAAALYGTAAANGVVLITTKRGHAGEAEWDFYAETGQLEDRTVYPANFLAYQVIGDASAPFYTPTGGFNSTDFARCPNRSAGAGTCRQDGVASFNSFEDPRTTFWDKGSRERYGLSVRGGNERVTYYLSGEWQEETGILAYNTLDKMTMRANLNAAIREDVDVSLSTGYTSSATDFNANDNSIFSPLINAFLGEAYFIPETTKRDTESPGVARRNYGFGRNLWDLEQYWVNDDVDRLTLGSTVQYRPMDWLSLNANGGMDLISGHTYETVQPGILPISTVWRSGFRASDRKSDYTYTFNSSAMATFAPASEIFSTTTVGVSYNRSLLEQTECFGASLVQGTASCGTTSTNPTIDEDFFEVRQVGAYLSTEVAWRDKVFVAGAVRGDDNSTFGTDYGFITYPSASVSWVVGEEDWFPQLSFLSSLRVRSAWGTSGLRPNFRNAITLFSPTTVARGGGDASGITVNTTGNLELEPERSTEIEIGFDAALFDNRVGMDFTYFNKRSEDALISRRLPPSYGVAASRFENLGEIKNAGTETAISFAVLQQDNLGLDIRATLTTLDNEVVAIGEGVEDITFNRGLQRHREGHPAGAFFQPEVTWNDANGDGLLVNSEVTVGDTAIYIGPSLPTYQASFGADLRIFGWMTVSSLFEARGGNYQGNDSEAFRCAFRSTYGCPAVANPDASLREQAAYIADRFLGSAYGFVESADFVKWREVAVTLTPSEGMVNAAPQLDGVTLALAGRNLMTWTDYTGLDPETVEGGGNANFSQSEFNTQPPVRYLMIRLNYSF